MRNFVYPLIITMIGVFALAACDTPNSLVSDKPTNTTPVTTGITKG